MSDNEKAEANVEETPLRNTRSKDRKNEKTQEEQNHIVGIGNFVFQIATSESGYRGELLRLIRM